MQRWMKLRLKEMQKKFGQADFTMERVCSLMDEKFHDKEERVLVMLSDLKKEGGLDVSLDQKDSRRRIYRLKSAEDDSTLQGPLTRAKLESLCKEAADLIRTRVDYSFILLLLFFKRMSDKWIADYEAAIEKAMGEYRLTEDEAKKEATHAVYHDFAISEEYLWDNIRKEPSKLAENFSKAMKDIAEKNPQIRDIFENFDFHQFAGSKENQEILRQLIELFSKHSLQTVAPDILGDAYEWTLRYFAPQKAKEGEVYTPREVIKLLIEYLDPRPRESVYDPAAGSAGMLIIAHQHVREKFSDEEAKTITLFGQEVNFRTRALAKMNMYLHGIQNGQVEYGDALLYPKFKDGETFKKYDVIVANPPWNQDGYGEDTIKKADYWKQRYAYGVAPDQSADWLWIQHMLASAKEDTGRVAVVIDNGALFRGGKEKAIRQAMVDAGKIEAVILLPERLFYNTGAPGSIIVLRHNKPVEQRNKILFINASNEFEQHPDVRRLMRLNDNHINNIVEARSRKAMKNFSRHVSSNEITENDYNLNVTLYVYDHEDSNLVDVAKELNTIARTSTELRSVEARLFEQLTQIGYSMKDEDINA